MKIKHNWTLEELKSLYNLPFLSLISQANALHGEWHDRQEVQLCNLISIKTGGCPEDCKYCAQSSRNQTSISAQPMMKTEEVVAAAKKAIAQGATRVCLGAAWREVRDGRQFDEVIGMVKEIADLGVEVCCTLGMIKDDQAKRLKEAGLYAYNHNLDTSESFYRTIVTTRTYKDRLETLKRVEGAGLSVCCGGILGMGESEQDRLEFLLVLCRRDPHPESVPINRLVPVAGTPLAGSPPLSIWEYTRLIALARITMPQAMIRLSAGRLELSFEEQALCFLAGANSIFIGERLLTVENPLIGQDQELLQLLGLKGRRAFS